MNKIILVLVIAFFPYSPCAGQENQSFFVGNEKVSLRYSARSDVEKLLGKPDGIEYFERGGEDFFWKNFKVCSYDESKLSFHYDQNDAIIAKNGDSWLAYVNNDPVN